MAQAKHPDWRPIFVKNPYHPLSGVCNQPAPIILNEDISRRIQVFNHMGRVAETKRLGAVNRLTCKSNDENAFHNLRPMGQ